MSIVYVTQDVMVRNSAGQLQRKFDYTPAEKYGEIRILLQHGQALHSTLPITRQLLVQLRNFSEDDYLLPLGDPTIMAACSAIAATFCGGKIRVLRWDRREQTYECVRFDLTGKPL